MKTSYFARWKLVTCPVAISSSVPSFYHGPRFLALAPPMELVKSVKSGGLSHEEYRDRYLREVLGNLDAQETYDLIVRRHSKFATLLCYEKPSEFCHRHLVAEWFLRELGQRVLED